MARPTALDRPSATEGLPAAASKTGVEGVASEKTAPAVPLLPIDQADRTETIDVRDRLWMVAVVVTVLGTALIPLAWQPRWYFFGDTQIGAYGQWYHLGRLLRAGHWPVLDVQAWSSGNFAAEGQWGLFSPLTALIGLAATVVPNAVVFSTVVKIVLLVGGAVGVFCVVRSYRVGPAAAYLAAVAVTTGGATQYLESPSWVTGQMVWAMLPWLWFQLRRVARQRANPAPALVFGLSMVAVGYVYGVIYVAIAVLGCMVDAFRSRNHPGAARTVLVGVLCAFLSIAVYLPGVLTAPVTIRGEAVLLSDGRLQGTVYTIVTGMLPVSTDAASYVIWFLPALAWLSLAKLRALLRPLTGLLIGLVLTLAWVIGPNQIGPIRWPIRVLPILTLFVVISAVIALARARVDRVSVGRLRASLVILAVAAFIAVSRNIDSAAAIVAGTGVVALGLLLAWITLRGVASPGARKPRSNPAAVLVIAVVTSAVVVLQHSFFPQPPSANRNMPTSLAGYAGQASAAVGDVFVVGDPEQALVNDPRTAADFLIASSWYINPQSVQNEYTTIGYRSYVQRYCVRYNGTTCPTVLQTLFADDPATGVPRVDLLSISTLQIFRSDFTDQQLASAPTGWYVAASTPSALTWVRDDPLPTSGGVSWSSAGTQVSVVSESARTLVLSVGEVPTGGGRVVLSRLDWPGYQVNGAGHAAPTDGYLLTLDVPASATGSTITVSFQPPGWTLEKWAVAAAVVGSLLWIGLHLVLVARRRRSDDHSAAEPPASTDPD